MLGTQEVLSRCYMLWQLRSSDRLTAWSHTAPDRCAGWLHTLPYPLDQLHSQMLPSPSSDHTWGNGWTEAELCLNLHCSAAWPHAWPWHGSHCYPWTLPVFVRLNETMHLAFAQALECFVSSSTSCPPCRPLVSGRELFPRCSSRQCSCAVMCGCMAYGLGGTGLGTEYIARSCGCPKRGKHMALLPLRCHPSGRSRACQERAPK